MSRRNLVGCVFESLEGRLLLAANPSPLGYSTNWSGYAVVETAQNSVSAVSGSWTVPAVTGSGRRYSSDWVGIDGFSSYTVEQLGTESDTATVPAHDGTPQYYAWFEMYPAYPWIIPQAVNPGDAVTASVQFLSSSYTRYTAHGNAATDVFTVNRTSTTKTLNENFQLTITDSTENWTFSIPQSIGYKNVQRDSAEWIVEAPSTLKSVLPLANFNSITFTNAEATIDGITTPIGSNPPAVFDSNFNTLSSGWIAIDKINLNNGIDAATSMLNTTGDSFTVAASSRTPAAPGADTALQSVFSDTSISTFQWSNEGAPNSWDGSLWA